MIGLESNVSTKMGKLKELRQQLVLDSLHRGFEYPGLDQEADFPALHYCHPESSSTVQ
jgi:hypothetical protein